MRIRAFSVFCATLITVLLSCVSAVFAAGTLSISSSGNGVFTIYGNGISNVAAMDIPIAYDVATLSNPRVQQGSLVNGALFVPNATQPGMVHIALVHPDSINGDGPVAIITFDRKGAGQGKILSFTYVFTDASGQDSVKTGGGTTDTSTVVQPEAPIQTITPSTGLGTLTIGNFPAQPEAKPQKDKDQPKKEETPVLPPAAEPPTQPATSPLQPLEENEESEEPLPQAAAKSAPAAASDSKYVVHKGILDRFRNFTGAKTPQGLIALFDGEVAAEIRQEPPIALSDGATSVKIIVDLQRMGDNAPNFAIMGASMKSLRREGDNRWIVEALPEARRYEATLTILNGERVVEFPLTIAPPMDVNAVKGTKLGEADFVAFLNGKVTEKAPRLDLNGDGKRDYIDEYIYTANYIILNNLKKSKTK